MRTVFAIAVVFQHSPWNDGFVFVGGRNAVQLFYMISGFLINHIITTNPAYRDPFKFYLNRALRLYPIYYFVALLSLAAVFFADRKFFDVYHNSPASANVLLVFSNLFLIGQDWVMFSGVKEGHFVFTPDWRQSDVWLWHGLLVPQAWTLGVELSFYALAPFIIRRGNLVILLVLLSMMVRGYLISIGLGFKDPWVFRFFPSELSLFLLGALSNKYLLPFWQRLVSAKRYGWLSGFLTYAMILVSLFYFLIPGDEAFKTLALFFVFLIFLPLTFIYQNTSKVDKAIGNLSYSIYMGHGLVVMVFSTLARRGLLTDELFISLANVAGAMVFAYFLDQYIGKPIERVRTKLKSVN